jgi:predicted acylesterase/phospholipase RssA
MPSQHRTRKKKRAIALAGGGPAAGLHIGALAGLEEAHIRFDVFSLSCVGAWVGIVYHTRDPRHPDGRSRAQQTFDYFEKYCFRPDWSYEWFPMNRGFATDLFALWSAVASFMAKPPLDPWKLIPLPEDWGASSRDTAAIVAKLSRGQLPSPREVNLWMLDDVLAVNPVTRYLTSLVYKSPINGLSRIYYDDSPALEDAFQGNRLYQRRAPHIYHNAWRMPEEGEHAGRIQIFHNRPEDARYRGKPYLRITPQSLCACSALPYIEQSIRFEDGHEYTEGALVDTVNFVNLVRDHPDLDEIWVSRIVDEGQVRPAHDILGALSNLPMQFAAEIGDDDVKLFRQHLLNQTVMKPRVVEIPLRPRTGVTFEWKLSNLKQGYREGYEAVASLLASDDELARP